EAATSANARLDTASTINSASSSAASATVVGVIPRRSRSVRYRGLCAVSAITRTCSGSRQASLTSCPRSRSKHENADPQEPPPRTTILTAVESHCASVRTRSDRERRSGRGDLHSFTSLARLGAPLTREPFLDQEDLDDCCGSPADPVVSAFRWPAGPRSHEDRTVPCDLQPRHRQPVF